MPKTKKNKDFLKSYFITGLPQGNTYGQISTYVEYKEKAFVHARTLGYVRLHTYVHYKTVSKFEIHTYVQYILHNVEKLISSFNNLDI